MMPNYYLSYVYTTDRKLAEQAQWPPSRGGAGDGDRGRPAPGIRRSEPVGTAAGSDAARRRVYYATLATQLLNAHYNDLGETARRQHPCIVARCTGWPADWVLEMPVRVAGRVEPLPVVPLPLACFGLVAAVKSYELLTVEAAVHGDGTRPTRRCLSTRWGPSPTRCRPSWTICWRRTASICRSFFRNQGTGDRKQGSSKASDS